MTSVDLQKTRNASRMKNIVMSTICLLLLGIICLSPAPAVSADEIKSRAAVVMDAETGKVLFAKNPDLRLMPASTTKLMTALVVLERTDVRDAVTVSGRAASAPSTASNSTPSYAALTWRARWRFCSWTSRRTNGAISPGAS